MTEHHTWYKERYFISTDPSLLDLESINEALDSDQCYWAHRYDLETLKRLLFNSLCFGVYLQEDGQARPKQIGLGRMITDRITFAYLTDLYILPAYSGRGLGSWLITVITELLTTWPECRRLMFLTNDKGKSFYEKIEKASLKELEFGKAGLVVMGRSYAGAFAPV